ncbi:hypothetical protein ACJIZ3_023934 [Penstemon smallii]|uniref:Uncharacterized protein n=1 Tax=Penstemon smallii TaxID=265156 RepID=A0ABD3TTH2_9LAMI
MNDVVSAPLHSQSPPLLRRRNFISTSIVIVPTKLTLNPSSATSPYFHSDDLELLSIKHSSNSYTSLKDLLPSFPVNSPMPSSDICIRDRLVKQAAWAYLQPASTSSGSAGSSFFHRLLPRLAVFTDFVRTQAVQALHWMLRVIRIRSSI